MGRARQSPSWVGGLCDHTRLLWACQPLARPAPSLQRRRRRLRRAVSRPLWRWPMHGVQVDLLPCRAPLASATTIPKSCSLWRQTVRRWRRRHPGLAEIEACACGRGSQRQRGSHGRLVGPTRPQGLPLGPPSSSQDPTLRGNAPSLTTDRLGSAERRVRRKKLCRKSSRGFADGAAVQSGEGGWPGPEVPRSAAGSGLWADLEARPFLPRLGLPGA